MEVYLKLTDDPWMNISCNNTRKIPYDTTITDKKSWESDIKMRE